MMEKFRNLSENIFFKIFLAFLGLSFVMFGISGFLLTNKSNWIAKIGNKTISYDSFLQNYQNDRQVISRANHNKEALDYLDSLQFKQDVLGRMISNQMVELLQKQFQIYPDRNLILAEIAKNPQMQDKEGKFDRNIYQNFLKSNELNEKDYINNISKQIFGNFIVQSITQTPSLNQNLGKTLFQHRFETRRVDLISISSKNITNVPNPSDFDLNAFFEKNRDQFTLKEMRKVSLITFEPQNLKQEIIVSDSEINDEYQKNKDEYQTPESRNFYHISLKDEKEARNFIESLKKEAKNPQEAFIKLAKEKGKNQSTISLNNIVKKDLPKEVAENAFSLKENQYSQPVKSPFGFEIFYLLKINQNSEITLDKVKKQIGSKILSSKKQNQLANQIKAIEDEILATNSIEKVAQKFGLKVNYEIPKFDYSGLDYKKQPVIALKSLDDFTKNIFSLEKGKVSKVFFSRTNNQYYIAVVDKIEESRKRSLDEVKVAATDMWLTQKTQEKLQQFANKIAEQINGNADINSIIAQNKLKIEKDKQLPRFFIINSEDGKKTLSSDKFLDEIFSTSINKATKPKNTGPDQIVIAIVKKIEPPKENDQAIKIITSDLQNNFKNDVLNVFDQYIKKQFPVEVNQQLMQDSKEVSNEN